MAAKKSTCAREGFLKKVGIFAGGSHFCIARIDCEYDLFERAHHEVKARLMKKKKKNFLCTFLRYLIG